jgi:hypothetical protein
MSLYSLTESYSEIYDHRKAEDLFDNLRFLDYMQDEDIQEVVESLVWEFRDYGNTLAESFDMLSFAASDTVICESYDQLVEDILTEATITKGSQRSQYAGSAQGRVTAGRGDVMAQQAAARKLAKKSGRAVSGRLEAEADQQSQQRREVRRARVDGAISRVKSAMAGAKGGMGRASKALGVATRQAGSAVAGLAQKGKALLGSLLRRGATAAGKAVSGAGKALQSSGRAAAAAPAQTKTANVGGRKVTLTYEPTPEAGGKRRAVGSAVRKVGVALQRMGKGAKQAPDKKQEPRMSRTDYEQRKAERTSAAKKEVGDAFTKPKEPKVTPPAKAMLALPAKTSGQPAVQRSVSTRKQEAAKKIQKAAEGSTARGVRFAGPTGKIAPTRTKTGYKERLAKLAPQLTSEDYETLIDYILEDIISGGYASDELEALDIFESLTEDNVIDIALEYFND